MRPERARVAVIGLSHPFRGGIAHYSTLLVRKLRERHEIAFLTLSRQYPGFLFPGKTQYDFSSNPIVEPHQALIDSINPLTWARVARRLNREHFDLIIFNWWQPFFGAAFGTIALLLSKQNRGRICYLCHNVMPHEQHVFERLLCRFAFAFARYFIVHSEKDRQKLLALKKEAIIRRNCHPTYAEFAQWQELDKAGARKRVGLPPDGRVLLFFGLVRPYKGLKYLIEAMAQVQQHLDCRLMVVGEFYDDKDRYVAMMRQLGLESRIHLVDRYVNNEEVGLYFSCADVVVLPYVDATQSGIVQIAYGFGTPVITTKVGGLPEAVEDGVTGFLVDARNSKQLSAAIVRFYDGNHESEFRQQIKRRANSFDWAEEVESIEFFIEQASRADGGGGRRANSREPASGARPITRE